MNIKQRNNISVIDGVGETIVYGHGFGCNKEMWRGITPAFKGKYRQVLFDYVGSGQSRLSDFSVDKYSQLSGYAQDIIDVCDAMELTKNVIFVGHSVSCSAGILASIKRPELFKSMILVGPTPCFLNLPDYHGGFDKSDLEDLLALMEQNYIGWANYLTPIVAGAAQNGQISGELSDSFCSTDPLTARIFARTTFFADNREDFKHLECPVLILQHKEDTLAPKAVGDFMRNTIPNNVFQEMDVKGHCAHMSHPDLVIDAMKRYLETSGI